MTAAVIIAATIITTCTTLAVVGFLCAVSDERRRDRTARDAIYAMPMCDGLAVLMADQLMLEIDAYLAEVTP